MSEAPDDDVMVELIPAMPAATSAGDSSRSTWRYRVRKLGMMLSIAGLPRRSPLGLAACGRSSDGKEGGTLTGSFAVLSRTPSTRSSPTRSKAGRRCTTPTSRCSPSPTPKARRAARSSRAWPRAMPKITDGGKTYTLTLRTGLKYSDGTPVKASDFKSSVERMFKLNSSGTPYYTVIEGAEAVPGRRRRRKSPGSKPTTRRGKIVIHLTEAAGRLRGPPGAALRRARPGRHAGQDGDQDRAAGDRALRDRQASSPAAAGPTSATRSGRRTTRR